MRKLKRFLAVLIFLLPAIFGGFGYLLEGDRVADAFYQSVSMYFFNANTTDNHFLVELSRWTAPIMTISGIALIVKELFQRIGDFFVGFFSDAVAVYGNTELSELVKQNIPHTIVVKTDEIKDVKRQILLFDKDDDGLKFYMKNKDAFSGKEVYIKLKFIDCLQANVENVKFFNINEIIARKFWNEYYLKELLTEKTLKIALIGSDVLAEKLLYYGLLNNLYTIDQKIEYHVWGAEAFESIHREFETMNGDTIVYHKDRVLNDLPLIAAADRIIVADADNMALLDVLTSVTTAPIYYFDPSGTFVNVFGYEKLYPFGKSVDILTAENIFTDKLQMMAKRINYEYECNYGSLKGCADPENRIADTERLWSGLSPFLKSSNIAAGDYHSIRLLVMQHKGNFEINEEVCELEHIRWCRYHLLNHWKHGFGPDGKKDKQKKLHPCLVPFDELCPNDRWKDRDTIAVLLDLEKKDSLLSYAERA